MGRIRSERGFTFIEVLTAVAIIALLSTVSIVAFRNLYRASAERTAAIEVVNALRDARTKTLSAEDDTVYGVRIASTSVTRFVGDIYSMGSASNTVYVFEGGASAAGTLVQNGVDIVFERLTGEPTATGTIYIRDIDNKSTTTITLSATGLIQ